jgi:hypothetical protein
MSKTTCFYWAKGVVLMAGGSHIDTVNLKNKQWYTPPHKKENNKLFSFFKLIYIKGLIAR